MLRRTIGVSKVFGARDAAPRARRWSDPGLLAFKALLLLAAAPACLSAGWLRNAQATTSVTNEWQGHALRCPRSWWVKKEGIHLATVVSELKSDHMQLAPRLLPRPEGIQVRIERFALTDPGDCSRLSPEAPLDGLADATAPARVAARHVRIETESTRQLRPISLMGKPAVQVSGPTAEGWAAVIATLERDAVVLMQIAAPSRFDFDRAAPTWPAMARSLRRVPLRSYKALGLPAADGRDPGYGSSEEGCPELPSLLSGRAASPRRRDLQRRQGSGRAPR